jgi:LDH2 family malate/lactate/ureidoglycolate dehydrogenase
MSSDRIHLSVAQAREHSEGALRGIGYDAEEARIIADHAVDAALCGYEYSGLAKILNIPEHRRFKRPRYPMKVLRETEISTLYDGGTMLACWSCITRPARRSRKPRLAGSRWWASPIAG